MYQQHPLWASCRLRTQPAYFAILAAVGRRFTARRNVSMVVLPLPATPA